MKGLRRGFLVQQDKAIMLVIGIALILVALIIMFITSGY
jgi:multisubunit Na+/H+ antiporter MnhC subunit